MRKRREARTTISLLEETRDWISRTESVSRYVSTSVEWRSARLMGSMSYLKRIDKELVRKAIKALEGMDWGWYPEPDTVADRLSLVDGGEDWGDFISAVRDMPQLAYALESVTREYFGPNRRALLLLLKQL